MGCDADIVILAGDIGVGTKGVEWAIETFAVPVIYVAGNHEYHAATQTMAEHINAMKDVAKCSNVMVLDNETIEVNGVRFIGTTMWTDVTHVERVLDPDAANIIPALSTKFDKQFVQSLFETNVAWLKKELNKQFDRETVVVSHHAPSKKSVSAEFEGNQWNDCFVTDLESLMGSKVHAWIHGHVHSNHDYKIDGTRIICNSRGYASPFGGWNNHFFNPKFTFEISMGK